MTNGPFENAPEKPTLKTRLLLEMSSIDSILTRLNDSISSIDECEFKRDGPFVNVFVQKPDITRLLKDVLASEKSLYTARRSGGHGRLQPERIDEQSVFDGAKLPEYEDLDGKSIVQIPELLIDSQDPDFENTKLEEWVLEKYPFLVPTNNNKSGFTLTCRDLRQFLQANPKVIENQNRAIARLEQYEYADQLISEQQVDALIAQEEKAVALLRKKLGEI